MKRPTPASYRIAAGFWGFVCLLVCGATLFVAAAISRDAAKAEHLQRTGVPVRAVVYTKALADDEDASGHRYRLYYEYTAPTPAGPQRFTGTLRATKNEYDAQAERKPYGGVMRYDPLRPEVSGADGEAEKIRRAVAPVWWFFWTSSSVGAAVVLWCELAARRAARLRRASSSSPGS